MLRSEGVKDALPGESERHFLQWIEARINQGWKLNTAQALVHILIQGVLIVNPLAFWKFARQQNMDWNDVQDNFRNLRINLKNYNDENWFRVRVEGKKISLLTDWIILLEHLSLNRHVQGNKRLTLVVQEMDQTNRTNQAA